MKIRLSKLNKICFFHTAFLGDVALSLYACQLLKKAKPELKITFVTTPLASSFIKYCNCIDEVIVYNKNGVGDYSYSISKIARIISKQKFDCIVTPHKSLRTARIINKSRKKYSIAYKSSAMNTAYSHKVPYYFHKHEIFRVYELLKQIDYFKDLNLNEIPVLEFDFEQFDKELISGLMLVNNVNKFIYISPGSIWGTKRWPKEYFIELINEIKATHNIILNGSPDEVKLCDEISQATGAISFAGKLSLIQTLYLIKLSDGVISNDSAPIHFAQLMRKPILAIFGPTIPEFGFAPIIGNFKICEDKTLKCRPCNIHGEQHCPKKSFDCMLNLTPDKVSEAALELFQS